MLKYSTEYSDLMAAAYGSGDAQIYGFSNIPYGLISEEAQKDSYDDVITEFSEINAYYAIYRKGAKFVAEGTKGDYLPSMIKYKKSSTLVNKEARFLFSQPPDIKVNPKGGKNKISEEDLIPYQDLVDTVLKKNGFESQIVKAAKDCFIGKRVALMVNFNSEGIQVNFYDSLHFIYSLDPMQNNVLDMFTVFVDLEIHRDDETSRIFVKRYEREDGVVYLSEKIVDGNGKIVTEKTKRKSILLPFIPATVIFNDGLLSDIEGMSEISEIFDFESAYSKIGNADIDSNRKNMNPITYTIDMNAESTENLPTGPGAYWDLHSDQALDNPRPSIGKLSPDMSYSEPIKATLARINTAMYETLDVPDVNTESLQGIVPSGKTLKAIYWPLIVRCDEKMKTWGPALEFLATTIIEGAKLYPFSTIPYEIDEIGTVLYEIGISVNYALPEDVNDEKAMALDEVAAQVKSKQTYMQEWFLMTPEEAKEELERIAEEINLLEGGGMDMEEDGEPLEEMESDEGIEEEDMLSESMFDDDSSDDAEFDAAVDEAISSLVGEIMPSEGGGM